MISATTPYEINMFVLIALKAAIKMWIQHGIKANRAYTPTNMRAAATKFTGKTYNRQQLGQAYDDLQAIYDKVLTERRANT